MTNLIRKLLIPTIFLGVIWFIILFISGETDQLSSITFLEKTTSTLGVTYYKMNLAQYGKSLEEAFAGNYLWENLFPEFPKQPQANFVIQGIINYSILTINWIMAILECVLLTPLKIIVYPINLILTLIGFNTNNGFMYLADKLLNIHFDLISYV